MGEQKVKITLRLAREEKALLDALATEERKSRNRILRRLLLNARVSPDILGVVEKAIMNTRKERGGGNING